MVIELRNIKVTLTENVLIKLSSYEQKDDCVEAGGVLLGGFIENENRYVITDISTPDGSEKCGRTFFVRDYVRAQRIIDWHWKESGGKINYLGEWHTHCCCNPKPSSVDEELLKMVIEDRSNVWNEVFLLIYGQNKTFYFGMSDVLNGGNIISEINIEGEF